MVRFINEVKKESIDNVPRFVNAGIDANKIARVATSGSAIQDIAFNAAEKIVNKISNLKRVNELSSLEIELNKKINDYDAEWTKKDKFDPQNYQDYTSGLNKIYEDGKASIASSEYTSSEDVLTWKTNIENNKNNNLYKVNGLKNQYDIKKETNAALINIEALSSEYTVTGNEETQNKILEIYNNLENVGVPKHEIENLKMRSLVKNDSNRIEYEINNVINNTSLSTQDRLSLLKQLSKNYSTDEIYQVDADNAVKKGLISKEYADSYKSISKTSIDNLINGANGIINRMNEQIRNEQFMNEQRAYQYQEKINRAINNDIADVNNSINSGNDTKAISTMEGETVLPSDIINDYTKSNKYYGKDSVEMLKNNEYIPVFGIYELNDIKNKNKIAYENGVKRSDIVNETYQSLNNLEDDEKQHAVNQLLENGVITPIEYNLKVNKNQNISVDESNIDEIVNSEFIGKSKTNYNKLNGFVGMSNKSSLVNNINEKIGDNMGKRNSLSNIITGAITSGKFGVAMDITGGVTPGTLNQQYNNNPEFKKFVDDAITTISNVDMIIPKKAKLNKVDVRDIINSKYGSKTTTVREKKKETNQTTPVLTKDPDYYNIF